MGGGAFPSEEQTAVVAGHQCERSPINCRPGRRPTRQQAQSGGRCAATARASRSRHGSRRRRNGACRTVRQRSSRVPLANTMSACPEMQKSDRPSPTTTLTEDECGSVKAHLQLPARARQSLRAEGKVTRQPSRPVRLEVIGVERHLEPGVAQHALDDEIEPVGDDGHADAVARALIDECGKARVDAQLREGIDRPRRGSP